MKFRFVIEGDAVIDIIEQVKRNPLMETQVSGSIEKDVSLLYQDMKELFEERAAIIEYDGDINRSGAEILAREFIQQRKHLWN